MLAFSPILGDSIVRPKCQILEENCRFKSRVWKMLITWLERRRRTLLNELLCTKQLLPMLPLTSLEVEGRNGLIQQILFPLLWSRRVWTLDVPVLRQVYAALEPFSCKKSLNRMGSFGHFRLFRSTALLSHHPFLAEKNFFCNWGLNTGNLLFNSKQVFKFKRYFISVKVLQEPWSSGYGKRLTFRRSWVRIPAPYIGWTFFHIYLL